MSEATDSRTTMDPEQSDLLRGAIDEAAGALPALRAASLATGRSFRHFELAQGNRDLPVLAQNLGSLLVLTATVSRALHRSSDRASRDARDAAVRQLAACVDTLIAAKTGHDWIAVADLLEHDLTAMLDRWPDLLASLRAAALPGAEPVS